MGLLFDAVREGADILKQNSKRIQYKHKYLRT